MRNDTPLLSGRPGAAFLLPIAGLAGAAASGFAYAWATVYSPFAGYLSLLLLVGLTIGAALPLAFAGRLLKVRNEPVLRLNGALTGVATVWFAWVAFVWVFLFASGADPRPSLVELAGSPGVVWSFATAIAEDGWYTLAGSWSPRGALLWAFWFVEAAAVIIGCTVLSTRFVTGRGFCEACRRWLQPQRAVRIPADDGTPGKLVKNGGLAAITAVAPPSAGAARWVVVERQQCPACGGGALFAVDDVAMVRTEKGRTSTTRPLVGWTQETPADAAQIQRLQDLLRAADDARFASIEADRARDRAAAAR